MVAWYRVYQQALKLSVAAQLNVYEACGLLLGASAAPMLQVVDQLQRLLYAPTAQLTILSEHASNGSPSNMLSLSEDAFSEDAFSEDAFSEDANHMPQAAQKRTAKVAFLIAVIAVVSKGFSALPEACPGLRCCFVRSTRVAFNAMSGYCSNAEVRSKAHMLLHRMANTLGEELLCFVDAAVPQLVACSDTKEIVELVTLVNQLVLKFRVKAISSATTVFASLAAATFAHLQVLDSAITVSSSGLIGTSGPVSDEVRERRALLEAFYSLVHSIVHSGLTSVLSAPQNAVHTAPCLRILLAGCVEGPDIQTQRMCFIVVQGLVEAWTGTLVGFDSYVLREVLPVCFSALAQPHFSFQDASALPLLDSSVALQKTIFTKLRGEMVTHVGDQVLPSLGCAEQLASAYIRHIVESDELQLRDFIRIHLVPLVGSSTTGHAGH